jgi:hypothetical protein
VTKEELAKRLKSITDYVRDCERRVTQGEIMDLQGLDNNVAEVCDLIAALPGKDGQELESQMTVLIASLETLADAMRKQDEGKDD